MPASSLILVENRPNKIVLFKYKCKTKICLENVFQAFFVAGTGKSFRAIGFRTIAFDELFLPKMQEIYKKILFKFKCHLNKKVFIVLCEVKCCKDIKN